MEPRRARALIVGALVVVLAVAFAPRVTRKMADFEVYWTSAARARAAEPLYRAEDGHYQFKYLPAFAILAMPIAMLPLETAKHVWFGVSVALLLAILAMSVRLLPERRKPAWLIVVASIVVLGKFYGHELVLGQVNLLFGVVVLAALAAIRHGREALAGALVALAIVVKPYAVLFVPWLLARRRAASIAAAGAGLAVTAALPALTYGISGTIAAHAAWWRTVTESTAPNLTNPDNVSIAGMFAKWLGSSSLVTPLTAIVTVALLGAAAIVFVWRRRARAYPEGLEGALLLTLVPLLSPQGWDYVFLVSTLAIAYVVNYENRLPPALRVPTLLACAAIGLSLYDVMGRAAYGAFMALSIVTVCYLVVVAALCTLRWRGAA